MKKEGVLVELFEGDRIVRANSLKHLNSRESWKENDKFVKVFIKEMGIVSRKLKASDMLLLMRLTPHICYTSSLLTKSGRDIPEEAMDLTSICTYTELDRSTVKRAMKNLITNNIIFHGKKDGRRNMYFVNPYLFLKGSSINPTLKSMFRPIVR